MKIFKLLLLFACLLLSTTNTWAQENGKEQTTSSSSDFDLSIFADYPWLNCDDPKSYLNNNTNLYLLVYLHQSSQFFNETLVELDEINALYPEVQVVVIYNCLFPEEKNDKTFQAMVLGNHIEQPIVRIDDEEFIKSMEIESYPLTFLYSRVDEVLNYYENFSDLALAQNDIQTLLYDFENSPFLNRLRIQENEFQKRSFPVMKPFSRVEAAPSKNWLFLTSTVDHRIVAVNSYGQVVHYIGSGKQGDVNSTPANAQFNNPQGLAWDDKNNTLYIADTENQCIKKYTYTEENQLRTRVETYIDQATFLTESNELSYYPVDLAVDGKYLLIAMKGLNQIWKYDMEKEVFDKRSFAKNEIENIDEIATKISTPIAIDQSNSMGSLIYSAGNNRLIKWQGDDLMKSVDLQLDEPMLSNIFQKDKTTLAVSHLNNQIRIYDNFKLKKVIGSKKPGYVDGKVKKARFYHPVDITYLNGKYYVLDQGNMALRVINSRFKKVSTLIIDDVNLLIDSKQKDYDEIDFSPNEIQVNQDENKIKIRLDLDAKFEMVPSSINRVFDLGPEINEGTYVDLDDEDFNDGIVRFSVPHGESSTYSKLIFTMEFREKAAPYNIHYKKVNLQVLYDFDESAGTSHEIIIPMN